MSQPLKLTAPQQTFLAALETRAVDALDKATQADGNTVDLQALKQAMPEWAKQFDSSFQSNAPVDYQTALGAISNFIDTAGSLMNQGLAPENLWGDGGVQSIGWAKIPFKGELKLTSPHLGGWMGSVALLPNGQLAVGGHDGCVRGLDPKNLQAGVLWMSARLREGEDMHYGPNLTPQERKATQRIAQAHNSVSDISVLPEGTLAVSCGDGTVRGLDPKNLQAGVLWIASGLGGARAVTRLSDETLAVACQDGCVRGLDPKNLQAGVLWTIPSCGVTDVTELSNGTLAVACNDGCVRGLDPKNLEAGAVLWTSPSCWAKNVTELSDGTLAVACHDGCVRGLDRKNLEAGVLWTIPSCGATDVTELSDGALAVACYDGHVRIFE